MSEIEDARPPTPPSTANGQKSGGRPRLPLSEEALEAALVAGLDQADIAARFRVSERTVRRRLSDARKKHGAGWPVMAAPAKPDRTPPTSSPPRDFSDAELAWTELVRTAKVVHARAMAGAEVGKDALAAAGRILSTPPPPESPPDARSGHEALLEDLRAKATAITDQDKAKGEPIALADAAHEPDGPEPSGSGPEIDSTDPPTPTADTI